MSIADELIARLRAVPGIATVFDTEPTTDRYTFSASPTLILQHISGVPSFDGNEERWQVSVIGSNLANVRTIAQGVIDSLHLYRSDTIRLVEYESWPGTIAEGSGSTRTYHAPVDFAVYL